MHSAHVVYGYATLLHESSAQVHMSDTHVFRSILKCNLHGGSKKYALTEVEINRLYRNKIRFLLK